MLKTIKLLFLVLAAAALVMGCSQEFEPSNSPTGPAASMATQFDAVSASTLVSANLIVYVTAISGNEVAVHNVTAPWDEMTVTFNSFGGAFDGTATGSFLADAWAYRYTDITPLVAGWLDGSRPNNGVLLQQQTSPLAGIASLEWDQSYHIYPMLEICYNTETGIKCITSMAVADTYIWETEPDNNFGTSDVLYAGYLEGSPLKKQALIRFDLPEMPEPASIGDFVWLDNNNNGIQDAGETGYPGAEVRLYDCSGDLVGMTTTDANGYYLFDNLTPGDYNIMFVLPENYTFSPQDQGADDTIDSDADPATGVAACTTLDPGEHDYTWDAGIYVAGDGGCTLTIGFWKNHGGFGPQDDVVSQYLPISLGSFEVTDGLVAHNVLAMKTYGRPSNGITKLMAQMLAVRLNEANGADIGAVVDELADADAFLSTYDWTDWKGLSKQDKKAVLKLKSTFDKYNKGIIGPGHCGNFCKNK